LTIGGEVGAASTARAASPAKAIEANIRKGKTNRGMRRRPFGQGATCGQAFPGGVGSESINTGRYYQHSILSQREAFASLKSVFDGRGASELGRSRKEALAVSNSGANVPIRLRGPGRPTTLI
jgi:hypothetical protein